MHVAELYVYPVKSLRGIALDEAAIGCRGIEFDRRWMVVDPEGVFMTQRTTPAMATIRTSLTATELILTDAGGRSVSVPLDFKGDPTCVRVWKSQCSANYVNPEADALLSDALGTECRLVGMPDSSRRQSASDLARDGDLVGFADGCPILIVSKASLDDLNHRIAEPIPINRFRPNVVVDGAGSFDEDGWRRIEIDQVHMRYLKRCGRCIMTTQDHETGERRGEEPLRTLTAYRLYEKNVLFGAYFAADTFGVIRRGDRLLVKEKTPSN